MLKLKIVPYISLKCEVLAALKLTIKILRMVSIIGFSDAQNYSRHAFINNGGRKMRV